LPERKERGEGGRRKEREEDSVIILNPSSACILNPEKSSRQREV